LLFRNTSDKAIDHHLLPSIFLYPAIYLDESMTKPESTHKYGFMCGIRILQIVKAHDDIIQRKDNQIERLLSKELADLCFHLFSYPKEITMAMIEEFGEYEYLNIGNNKYVSVTDKSMYKVSLTSKADYLLTHLINDVGYLNLSSMRILLKSIAFSNPNVLSFTPFIKAAYLSYDTPKSFNDSLDSWVTCKILNSLSAFKLIEYVNDRQKPEFLSRLSSLNSERLTTTAKRAFSNGIFNYQDEVKDDIYEIVCSIINSVSKRVNYGGIKHKIEHYLNYWSTK
jgi:hypothetical protein